MLKYVRPVVKRKDTLAIVTAAAPGQVLERTAADVSFLAGMLVDKFRYHLPLYRQHQRLGDHGIVVSRSSLNTWASRAIDLLEPIFQAQNANVLQSRVLAMDETSIKAGRKAKGKMRTGWLWPVYGDGDEIVFHFAPSREHRHVRSFLGEFRGTLLTDGYEGYAAYAGTRPGQVIHAQCWSYVAAVIMLRRDAIPMPNRRTGRVSATYSSALTSHWRSRFPPVLFPRQVRSGVYRTADPATIVRVKARRNWRLSRVRCTESRT